MQAKRRNKALCGLAGGFCIFLASDALATTYYVDDDSSGGVGTSWATAFTYLQDALDVAVSGDEIRVAAGTYRPDQGGSITPPYRDATFQLKDGVAILGGYYGCPGGNCGGGDPDFRSVEYLVTTLTGDLNGDDTYGSCTSDFDCAKLCLDGTCISAANNGENSYHVVTGSGTDATAVLDGFTITGGNALDTTQYGGGIYIDGGDPTIHNCTITRNTANWGGGIANNGMSDPTISNCTLSGNTAHENAGALLNNGGSPPVCIGSSPTITDCVFDSNWCDNSGGAMHNEPWSAPFIDGCSFVHNESGTIGSAIYNCDSYPTVLRTSFTGNQSKAAYSQYGGRFLIDHCLFSGNNNGVFNVGGSSEPSAVFSTVITGNRHIWHGTIAYATTDITFTNCVAFANEPGGAELVYGGGDVNFVYSDVEGGTGQAWFSTGSIDADPLFVSDGYWDDNVLIGDPVDDIWMEGDYRLTLGSPCIDAGDDASIQADLGDVDGDSNTSEQTPKDLAAGARFAEGDGSQPANCERTAVDMGPYEFQGACSSHADCQDCNGCTTGVCLLGSCIYFDVAGGSACNSGSACTTNDVCDGDGACQDVPDPCQLDVECDDCNDCTIDTCVSGACTYTDATQGAPCDDGLFCTATDTCDGAGTCTGVGTPCPKGQFCSEAMDTCISNP